MLSVKALAANSDGLQIFGLMQDYPERKIEVGWNEEDTNWVVIDYGIHRNTFTFNEEVYDMEDFPRVNVDRNENLEIRHMGDPIKETGIYARKEREINEEKEAKVNTAKDHLEGKSSYKSKRRSKEIQSEENVKAIEGAKLMYKVDEIVVIVGNAVSHGFAIGEHVRLTKISRDGDPDEAESLDGQEDWCIDVDDIKRPGEC